MKSLRRKYLVIRKPTIPEDDGRYFFIRSFEKHDKAWDWVEKQEGEYFKPGDYIVVEN
jgi:hypothetical protein